MDPLPGRPLPPRPVTERALAWLRWFGLARLVVIALAVAGVGAGAFWLLRAPPTPIENTLPMASHATSPATTSTPPPAAEATDGSAPVAPGSTPRVVVVDVAGAVAAPGVYELADGSRVHDAIHAAGGVTADADVESLNLASPLRDGDRLYVPHVGVPVPTVVGPAGGGGALPGASSVPAGPVDLNRATAAELDALPGIGPATASAIVDYRERVGPFVSVDDLLKVRGIGPAKLDAIRGLVTS